MVKRAMLIAWHDVTGALPAQGSLARRQDICKPKMWAL
jgi:hypothetical protein